MNARDTVAVAASALRSRRSTTRESFRTSWPTKTPSLIVSDHRVVVVVVVPGIDEVVEPSGVDVDEVPVREVGVREVGVDDVVVVEVVVDEVDVDLRGAVVVGGVVARAGVVGAVVVDKAGGTAL